MKQIIITKEIVGNFTQYLIEEEKSNATIEKYLRDVNTFLAFSGNQTIDKETVISYKQHIMSVGYAVRSINSMIASINCFLKFLGLNDFCVKSLKLQRQVFCNEDTELSKQEYYRLCKAAMDSNKERLNLIIQTICGTGIRVSELQYITVEAVRKGEANVSLKGKTRTVFIVRSLQNKLLSFIRKYKISEGSLFVTKAGKPLSRTFIWQEMKKLCSTALINPKKVFPHNLRHLFARIFYTIDKDIVKLADILGHSSISTTRIYIISTGTEHRKKMEQMRLII